MMQPDKDKKDKDKKDKDKKDKEKKEKEKKEKDKKSKKKDIEISLPSNFRSLDGDGQPIQPNVQPQYNEDDQQQFLNDQQQQEYNDDQQQQYYDDQQQQQYYNDQQQQQEYYDNNQQQYYDDQQPQQYYDNQEQQEYYTNNQNQQQQQHYNNQQQPNYDYQEQQSSDLEPPPLPEKKNCKLLEKVQQQQRELIENHQKNHRQKSKVYFKVSDELLEDVKKWENKKKDYSESINSLLIKKQQQLDGIFKDYLLELTPILDKHFPNSSDSQLKNEIQRNEQERLLSVKQNLFGSQNASITTIENQIKQRRTEINMHNKITLIQSIVRMWLAKKSFKVLKQHHTRRNLCLQEIVDTERKYVESLSLMIKIFLVPLQTTKKDLLSVNEVAAIFGNCSVIYGVHNELLESLETNLKAYQKQQQEDYSNIGTLKKSSAKPSKTPKTHVKTVAECFLSLSPFLKLYTQYINNFTHATTTLLECKKRDSKVNQFFFKDCKENKILEKRDFLDLQIQPVQSMYNILVPLFFTGIPRYKLLLTELLHCTPEDHSDYKNVRAALSNIQELAMNINESKRTAEGLEKIMMIQGSLTKNIDLVKPYRKHIKDASVFFEKRGKIKKRHLFLFNDSILLCKKVSTILGVPINNTSISNSISNSQHTHNNSSSNINNSQYNNSNDIRYIPLSFMDMNNVTVLPTQDHEYQHGFAVLGNEHLFFYTENAIEQHEWLLILKEITKELELNQGSLRKDQSEIDLNDSILNPMVKQQSNRDSLQSVTSITNPNRQSIRLSTIHKQDNQAKVVERYSVNSSATNTKNQDLSSSTLQYSPTQSRSSLNQSNPSPPLSHHQSISPLQSSQLINSLAQQQDQVQLQQVQLQLQQLQLQQNNYQSQIQKQQQLIQQQQLQLELAQQQKAVQQPVATQQPKLKELLLIYNEITQLQKELINPSNQFDILFNGQLNQLNLIRQNYPNVEPIYIRLSSILNKLTELKGQSSIRNNSLFKHEETITNLQNVIAQGKDHIGAYNEWIKKTFPLGPNDPLSHQPRNININLMKWYNSLHVAYLSILELN
ncbi:hypothetical protein DICPUDRAFT_148817 [Dictyostelium purpureum]|uniref:DH domain-containing protein n=1 Tax=Dictyostelium purpureum TaxID=5786 RepID=F0ZC33_DICPU|nr:uncharacterized protein DICPUDRAFT_148817 [Dictyostelium purpureum]EGC38518.1 hypothetical protein DICPUDRAFT_148817 [Dictyostelium purpureum]|eukprot:XP_003284983.1 hypothetical protein DICPUDRAFT_148817 [Dictyostelium purpureum]